MGCIGGEARRWQSEHSGWTSSTRRRRARWTTTSAVRQMARPTRACATGQVRDHLIGPMLAVLRTWDPVLGLVVGSY